jgi:hypothetical protein
LTPKGKKRHPMSFTPFLGGRRICAGKIFTETISKHVIPSIFGKYRLMFENEEALLNDKP